MLQSIMINNTIKQFVILDKALIDTSSIIYLSKLLLFDRLTNIIQIFVIPEVKEEYGILPEGIRLLGKADMSEPADEMLIHSAHKLKLPVISEDKKILINAQKLNIPFFNTLIMLNFLIFKRELKNFEYEDYLQQLQLFARYSPRIWQYGINLNSQITQI